MPGDTGRERPGRDIQPQGGPALYFADAQGRIRHHHFGEGEYGQSEMILQQLLADAGRWRR